MMTTAMVLLVVTMMLLAKKLYLQADCDAMRMMRKD